MIIFVVKIFTIWWYYIYYKYLPIELSYRCGIFYKHPIIIFTLIKYFLQTPTLVFVLKIYTC